ncbi:MAG: TPM domain-containing protein [Flavobacteriales bacterium]
MINQAENDLIVAAIQAAEQQTSGEIRVHIDQKCSSDPVKRAIAVFEKLGMHRTELRNGVLIYVSFKDRKLAIIGDQGIDQVVPADFWMSTKEKMIACFQDNRFADGLIAAISEAGIQLKTYFPHLENDTNELSNEISTEA